MQCNGCHSTFGRLVLLSRSCKRDLIGTGKVHTVVPHSQAFVPTCTNQLVTA